MPYAVAKNTCHSCKEQSKVYFTDGVHPKVGEVYRYLCQGCGQIVYYHLEAGTILVNDGESLPADATVAEKKVFH